MRALAPTGPWQDPRRELGDLQQEALTQASLAVNRGGHVQGHPGQQALLHCAQLKNEHSDIYFHAEWP
jgi:hypothetical protein